KARSARRRDCQRLRAEPDGWRQFPDDIWPFCPRGAACADALYLECRGAEARFAGGTRTGLVRILVPTDQRRVGTDQNAIRSCCHPCAIARFLVDAARPFPQWARER